MASLSRRELTCALAVVLPQRLKHAIYRRLGWDIARSARIGLSYLHAEHITIGPGAVIGHLNVVRNLGHFEVGRGAYVKHLNDFFGRPRSADFPDRAFKLGDRSLIMSRHFFDVCGRITIGRDCVVGGRDSHFWSHSQFITDGSPSLEPRVLILEDGVYTGARVTIVHCTVPPGATVGAGAVVTKSFEGTGRGMVIVGNPATVRG
jgi:serine acetyltransferase